MAKTKFTNLIDQIPQIAKKDNWVICYDKSLDSLQWNRKKISANAKMIKISHETSAYVNPKGQIEGVYVEYYQRNFLNHNPTVEKVKGIFSKHLDDDMYTVSRMNNDTEMKLSVLAESLRADIYKDAVDNEYSAKELNQLVSLALNS